MKNNSKIKTSRKTEIDKFLEKLAKQDNSKLLLNSKTKINFSSKAKYQKQN